MTKWRCTGLHENSVDCCAGMCEMIIDDCSRKPSTCYIDNAKVTWERVPDEPEQKQEENTLPDWCKVGEWIFDVNEDCYAKVLCVDDEIMLVYRGEKEPEIRSKLYIDDCCLQARLIPYTDDELKALVGKVVERGNFAHLVTDFQDNEGCFLRIYGIWYNAEELRTKGFELGNNIPFGTLEHLTNYGEWKA